MGTVNAPRQRLSNSVVQLTEHNDDASPGGAALVAVDDVHALHDALERTGAVQALAGVDDVANGPTLVTCPPDQAFATFTGRIDIWWPPEGDAPGPIVDVRIEPRVGGWGTVLTWDPGRRYRQSFTLAQDPAHPSELDVTFTPTARDDRALRARWLDGGKPRPTHGLSRLAVHPRPVRRARRRWGSERGELNMQLVVA